MVQSDTSSTVGRHDQQPEREEPGEVTPPAQEPAGRPHPRDLAASGVVLAGMAAAWLFWGAALAEPGWALALRLGAPVALALAVWGSLVRRRLPQGSRHDDPAGRRFWWTMVLIEVGAILAGAAVLQVLGLPMLVICWAHLVMGLHWWPMARFYGIPTLRVSTMLAVTVAIAGAALHLATGSWPGLVVGGLGGAAMTAMAVHQIGQARSLSSSPRSV